MVPWGLALIIDFDQLCPGTLNAAAGHISADFECKYSYSLA
jgi:hypothetical protein